MSIKNNISMGFGIIALIAPQYLLNDSLSLGPVQSDGLAWVVGVLLCGCVLGALVPRLSHFSLLGIVLAWLSFGVGLAEMSIVIFLLLSAWSMGAVLLCGLRSNACAPIVNSTEAVILGTVVWLAVWGAMLYFPINYRGLYLGLCLLPFLWLPRLPTKIWTDLRLCTLEMDDWMRSIPFWAWVAGVALIGWVLRWASFPSLTYDDHAQHLRIWTELLTERRALFDVHTQIWAVAPFATDLLHAGLSLMAGTDARSAMNLALALLLLVLFARILHRLSQPAWVQWLLMVLMASTPMLGNLLISLQTELLLAVLGLVGLHLVIGAEGGWRGKHVLGVLACAALCSAIKLPGVVLGAALLGSLALRWWALRACASLPSESLRWPALIVLIPLAFVALHSYALAWWATGNPVFPLYNAVFLSPQAPPENFSDPRWIHGFSLGSYVRAFFQTSAFFESGDYAAGWQYLLLLPISFVALWSNSVPAGLRLALVPLLGFGLVMFSATQYWRYLFPAMPIAGIVLASLFIGGNRWWRAVFSALALLCIALNIIFFTRISWMMVSPAQAAYSQAGKNNLARIYAPATLLTAEINRLAPGSRVLYSPDAPAGATLHGTPLYVNWYAPSREKRFAAAHDAQTIASFLSEEKVDFVILNVSLAQDAATPLKVLREHLATYGVALAQEGPFVLYQLDDIPVFYREAFNLRNSVRKQPEAPKLLLSVSDAGVTATLQPQEFALFSTQRATHARYSVRLRCPSEIGFFVAQINWDVGAPYYRLVACSAEDFLYVEAIPIPPRAHEGLLHITVRDTTEAQIENLKVEIH